MKVKMASIDYKSSLISPAELSTLAKGAGIVFFGTIASVGLKYIFELIIARSLGPELFGVFFLGFTIFKVLERISTLGLPNGVLRYISVYRGIGDNRRIKGTIFLSLKVVLIAGLSISFFLTVFSNIVSTNLFNETNLSPVLKIFAIAVFFTAITEILVFSTQAFQVMKYKVLVKMLIEPILRIFFVIILFLLGWKLIGAVYSFLISTVIASFFGFYFLKKMFPGITNKAINPIYETKSVLNFSWPLFLVGFFNLFIIQINTLMLGYFGNSKEVGIYATAQRTAFFIAIILESFNPVFAPMIADFYNRKKFEKLEVLYKVVTKWIFTISLPMFLVLLIFPQEILSIWGKEYIVGWVALVIIGFAELINCSVGSAGHLITMSGRSKLNLVNTLFVFAAVMVLNFFLIPRYGVIGAALSMGSALIMINIIRLVEVFLILKIHPYRLDFFKPLIAGIIASSFIFLLKYFLLKNGCSVLVLSLLAMLLLIIYALIIYILKISDEDKFILSKIKLKITSWRHSNAK